MKKKIFFILLVLTLLSILAYSYQIKKPLTAGSQSTQISSQAEWETGTLNQIDSTSNPGTIDIDQESQKIDLSSCNVSRSGITGDSSNAIDGDVGTSIYYDSVSNYNLDCPNSYCVQNVRILMEEEVHLEDPENQDGTTIGNCPATTCWQELGEGQVSPEYTDHFYTLHDNLMAVDWARMYELEVYSASTQGTHTTASTQIDGTSELESWDTFTPTQTTPTNTSIEYEFRSSADGTTWTTWSSATTYDGANPIDLSGITANRYLQVRSTLSTTDCSSTPSIDDYTIAYTVTDADPCADSASVDIITSPAGDAGNVNGGDEFSFSAHNYDSGGGTINTTFDFSISPDVAGFSTSSGSGTEGVAVWNVPEDISPGDYVITVSTGCGESASTTLTVPTDPDPDPDPVDVCENFKNIKLDPAGGTYAAGRKIELSGYAIDESDSKMSGSLSYSLVSGSGNASLSDSGLLTMPLAGEKAIVSASHTCGSRSYTFSSYEIDCDELDHIELLPSSKELGKSQGYDFDAFAYRTDGSRYSSSQIGFNYTASKGSINSSGYHIADSSLGSYRVRVEDNGGCGVSDSSRVIVTSRPVPPPEPDPSGKGKLSIESPGGALDESGSVYTAYLDANNYSGETETCVNITPKMTYAGRDVTSKTNFNYELIYPTGVSRVDDQGIYCTSDISKVGRVDVGGIYGGRSYLVSQKINFYESDNDYFKVTRPNENSIWSIDSREDINWTSSELEEAIEQVKIEYSSNGGREYLGVVDNFPNTNNYSWQIPNDSSYASSQAKIRVSGYDSWGNYVISDESDQFVIKDKRDRVSPLDLKVDMSKLATTAAAQAPLMGLALIGLAWPYLIGAIGKNNFGLLTNFFGYLFQELKYLLSPYSKRPKKWGIVYDWDDKTPIAYAKLMLFDGESDKLKQVYYSNSKGEFGFKIEKEGEYYLEVEKPGYVMARDVGVAPESNRPESRGTWRKNVSDSYYSNLYFGQVFKVEDKKDSAVRMSIPLKLEERSWFSYLLVWLRRLSNFFYLIRIPVLIVGSLLALYLLVTQRTIIDLIVIGLYLIFWLIEILAAKKVRGYGLVKSEDDKPLDLVMVRAYDSTGRLVQTVITGPDGRFMLNIDPGDIILKIKKPGYISKIVEMDLKSVKDLSGVNIKLEASE